MRLAHQWCRTGDGSRPRGPGILGTTAIPASRHPPARSMFPVGVCHADDRYVSTMLWLSLGGKPRHIMVGLPTFW
jgi:hypothetical protein